MAITVHRGWRGSLTRRRFDMETCLSVDCPIPNIRRERGRKEEITNKFNHPQIKMQRSISYYLFLPQAILLISFPRSRVGTALLAAPRPADRTTRSVASGRSHAGAWERESHGPTETPSEENPVLLRRSPSFPLITLEPTTPFNR